MTDEEWHEMLAEVLNLIVKSAHSSYVEAGRQQAHARWERLAARAAQERAAEVET
jgi:hypothetical protein